MIHITSGPWGASAVSWRIWFLGNSLWRLVFVSGYLGCPLPQFELFTPKGTPWKLMVASAGCMMDPLPHSSPWDIWCINRWLIWDKGCASGGIGWWVLTHTFQTKLSTGCVKKNETGSNLNSSGLLNPQVLIFNRLKTDVHTLILHLVTLHITSKPIQYCLPKLENQNRDNEGLLSKYLETNYYDIGTYKDK